MIGYTNVWYSSKKMEICVTLVLSGRKVEVLILIDSGVGGVFIDLGFVKEFGIVVDDLLTKIDVYNVDGTLNQNGSITQEVEASLEIQGRKTQERFLVIALGTQQIILGYSWLEKANPKINWRKKEFSWWDDDEEHVNIYTLLRELIEKDAYETTEDLVISYLGNTQHEITDQWISEQYGEIYISATSHEKPQQVLTEQ